MIIAFVVDIYKDRSNGTSMSAFRCARELLRRGHEVRIIATQPQDAQLRDFNTTKSPSTLRVDSHAHTTSTQPTPTTHHAQSHLTESTPTPRTAQHTPDAPAPQGLFEYGADGEKLYLVKERYIPLVTEISHRQHMVFGAPDENRMREALQGCDVVHLFLPFRLEIVALRICRMLKIPYTAAFHLQPQHISYNMNADFAWFNDYLYRRFFRALYRYTHHIHCPSLLMKQEIERIGYGGKHYVISNGFDMGEARDKVRESPKAHDGFFHIASVGRFSKEKRQDILIRAIATNKYAHKIKLHLHGIGPREAYLKGLCERLLPNPCEIGFIDNALLLQKLQSIHLYCHPAQVESEAISCLEAISLGVVPLIADSKISATNQFALDSRSLFKTNDVRDLSEKITYWIENPSELESMRETYKQSAHQYALSLSIDKLLAMFEEAIVDFKSDSGLFEKYYNLASTRI